MDAGGGAEEPIAVLVVGTEANATAIVSTLEGADETLDVSATPAIDEAIERTASDTVECILWVEHESETLIEDLECVRAGAPKLPFVLLAGADADVATAIELGVTDVVETPLEGYRVTLLVRRLRGHVERYRRERRDRDGCERQDRNGWGESQFRAIFEHSPNMISIHDQDGVIRNVNRRTCEMLGYERDELIGMNVAEIEVEFEPEELEERWHSYEFGEPISVEGRNRRADGTEFPVRVSLGQFDLDGEDLILAILRDVSEEKVREHELERYERIVENVPIGVFRLAIDPERGFEFVNPAMVTMVGSESETQLLERSLEDVCPNSDVRERLRNRLLDGRPLISQEIRLQTIEGEPFWGAVTAIRAEADGEVYVDGVVQDVTDRKRAETRRDESEAHLRQAQTVANFGSWYADVPNGTLEWSDEVYEIFERTPREESISIEHFFEFVHPDDRELVWREWTTALEGESYDVEHRIVVNGETRWVREKAEVTVDDEGEVTGAVGIVKDITDRKAYERRLEEQNEQLEVLNRIVRHDIRNHMNVVDGYASELAEHLDNERGWMAEQIGVTARELLATSGKIRQVSRLITDDLERRPVDLSTLVNDVLEESRESYPDAETVASVPESLWVQGTDALRFALENVVENALEHNDALEPRVEVTGVETGNDGLVELRVSDNGPGIPEQEYELLTGARESTQVEHTSGLGLWAVHWFVTREGGDLRFDVDDSRGTTVTLALPSIDVVEGARTN